MCWVSRFGDCTRPHNCEAAAKDQVLRLRIVKAWHVATVVLQVSMRAVDALKMVCNTGPRIADGLSGAKRWVQGIGQAPLQLSTGQRGVRRVQRVWHEQGNPQLQQMMAGITVTFVLKVHPASPLVPRHHVTCRTPVTLQRPHFCWEMSTKKQCLLAA